MPVVDRDLTEGVRGAYLIGIGGVGMSALARVLKYQGLAVSGSDSRESRTTRELAESGIRVRIGQKTADFGDAELVIYSSAIGESHVELQAARRAGKKVRHRAEILSSLLNRARTSVAVTGTHGKTTTSSMISFALAELGRNPTCLVGGDVVNFGTNTVLGDRDLWVSEVDESDKSHELYAPNYSVVTNLEEDHMDHYKDLEEIKNSFRRYLTNARTPGLIVYSADDPVLSGLVEQSGKPRLGFGFDENADFSARNVRLHDFGSEFELWEAGIFAGVFRLSVPGVHNIANALAALAVLTQLGADLGEAAAAIERFRGARRRLEIKWQSAGLVVIDDYAHHPTEVRASIRALRSAGGHLTVVFQPHRFSRTRYFFKQFGSAFREADEVILTDIYAAGETDSGGITTASVYQEVVASGHPCARLLRREAILDYLASRPGRAEAIVAFLGAGDIGELADEFANRFKSLTAA